jgi:hypothetical protein
MESSIEAQCLEARHITDRLIWSLPQSTGGLCFDNQVFDEQFHQLITDLRRSEFLFIVLVPLLGMTAESLPIVLDANIKIDRMTDEEIVRCLRLGTLPAGPHNFSVRIADVPSGIAVGVRYHLPKQVGGILGPVPLLS